MKIRKITSMLIIIALIASINSISFASNPKLAEAGSKTVTLKGFSYLMDGSQIDTQDKYSAKIEYEIRENEAILSVNGLENTGCDLSKIQLKKLSPTLFFADLGKGACVYLEIANNKPIVNISVAGRAYALGDGLRAGIKKEIDKNKAGRGIKTNDALISPKAAAGVLFTKSSSKIYVQAAFNPTKSNRVDLRVHTVSNQPVTMVQSCKILNGTLPSSYIVISCNPAGYTSPTDWSYVVNLILGLAQIPVSIPGQSGSNLSSWSSNTFSFNFSGNNVQWNTMGSSSGKGFAGHVFLDHNGVTPTFSARVEITYYVTMTGTFTDYLYV